MLNRILATVLKKNNKKLFISLLSIFIVIGGLSIYSWIIPRVSPSADSAPRIETTYAYQAVVTPNVLHPEGGMVEVGDTLYKKITTAIPLEVTSVIRAEEEVLAKGTYDVQLLIKAEGNWERTFTLQSEQDFEEKGTAIAVIDGAYEIDLAQVEAFISQVENETGVRQSQYELEIVPTIQGELQSSGKVTEIDISDKLLFNYVAEEIKLASEKVYSTAVLPAESQTVTTSFSVLGYPFSLLLVRVCSTFLSLLLLVAILFSLVYLDEGPVNAVTSEAERLTKKYGRRVIPISTQIDVEGKTIVPFASFTSMLKIADEIEQPIFVYEKGNEHGQMYLVVDVLCVYTYTPSTDKAPAKPTKDLGKSKEFVIG